MLLEFCLITWDIFVLISTPKVQIMRGLGFLHREWNSDVKKLLFSWFFFKIIVWNSPLKTGFSIWKVMKWMSNGFSLWRVASPFDIWWESIYYCIVRFSFLIDVEAFYSFYIVSETPILRNFHFDVKFLCFFHLNNLYCLQISVSNLI